MQKKNNTFILALAVIFLTSCVPSSEKLNKSSLLDVNKGPLIQLELNEIVRGTLIDSETFIADKKAQVKTTAETGPTLNNESVQRQKSKRTDRKQINKQERKVNVDVTSGVESTFPISINFENISIKDMSIMFSEITGKNILIGDEVGGFVSAKLMNVPWDKALDSILKIKKLAKYVDDKANIIRIHSQDVLVAQAQYDLEIIQALERTKAAQKETEPLYTEIFKLYYTTASKVSEEIKSVINGSSGEDDSTNSSDIEITIDERLNYLIVKASKAELDFIETIVSELDVRIQQVLIEAFIVEASEDLGKALGVQFGLTEPNANILGVFGDEDDYNSIGIIGNTYNAGEIYGNALGLILGTSTQNLAMALVASENKGITKILSNPRVFTLDGQTAEIKQVDQIPYIKSEDGEKTIELKEAGITLTVTPLIVGDGNIILTVEVEKSTVNTTLTNPPIATRTITTKLLIEDETIVVIGGVFTQSYKDSETKTPFLGDLPFIGALFKKDEKTDVRKEILVFLAPTII
jgi:type IV pilus assembly protein PilQ